MKEVIGKYAFEVIVIFIGITASFLFEEWRQNQEKNERAIEIMQSMVIELERNDKFIQAIDTGYLELDSAIQSFIIDDSLQIMAVAEISYFLMEEVPKFRLKNISSFIHGFSSADQLHILESNKDILQYLSYLEGLLTEHENYTNDVSAYASSNLWPLVYDYGLADYLICENDSVFNDYQKAAAGFTKKDINEIKSDYELIKHLKWSQLKIRRLIEINTFIHKHIKNTTRELNKAIENG